MEIFESFPFLLKHGFAILAKHDQIGP
jgi:hypothetical protein